MQLKPAENKRHTMQIDIKSIRPCARHPETMLPGT